MEIGIIAVIAVYCGWVLVNRIRKIKKGEGCCGDCSRCTKH